jgi:hypothetical protein
MAGQSFGHSRTGETLRKYLLRLARPPKVTGLFVARGRAIGHLCHRGIITNDRCAVSPPIKIFADRSRGLGLLDL